MNKPFAKAKAIADRFRALNGAVKRPLSRMSNKAEKTADLFIYESIGYDWWTGGGITGKSVKEALDGMKGVTTLNIYINSEGGDVFEAKAIYTNLKRFEGEKIVHIDGIAASAATFIAMSGDKIKTSPVATWMIHEAWTVAMGRACDLRSTADLLELENRTIAETYAKKTKGTVDEMLTLMAAETWMNAATALEKGFTDEITEDEPAADDADPAAAAKASPLVALAELTQSRLKASQVLTNRLEMHRRNHPGQPGPAKPASR